MFQINLEASKMFADILNFTTPSNLCYSYNVNYQNKGNV